MTCTGGFCRTPDPVGTCTTVGDDAATCTTGLTACGTACVDLSTAADHCGRCDHACGGTTCSAGRCEPATPASALYRPSKLAAGYGVFVYSEGDVGSCTAMARVTVARASNAARMYTNPTCATALAVGPSFVYVAPSIPIGSVYAYDPMGTIQATTDIGTFIGGIAVDASRAYLGAQGALDGVVTVDSNLADSARKIWTNPPRKVDQIVRTPNLLWFLTRDDANNVRRAEQITEAGDNHRDIEVLDGAFPSIGFGGGRVFLGESGGSGRLISYAEDGNDMKLIIGSSTGVIAVAADEVGVYWADSQNGSTRLWGRRHGTDTNELLAEEDGAIQAIAADGTWLYWLTSSAADTGALRRITK